MADFVRKILCALAVIGVGGAAFCAQAKPFRVVTSINVLSQPLAEAFEPALQAGVLDIQPLMDIGSDPHLYVPTRLDLSRLLNADLILFVGLGLEAQFDDVLSRISDRVPVAFVGEVVATEHLIGYGCDRAEHGASEQNGDVACLPDPHIWMDPDLFAAVLAQAVGVIERKAGVTAQMDVTTSWSVLGNGLGTVIDAACGLDPMITAHDAFRYYARAYGIETLGLAGISTDVEPSVRRVQSLVDRIVSDQIDTVFLESSVPPRGIQALIDAARRQGQSVTIRGPLYTDSLGPRGGLADSWSGMLWSNTANLVCGLGQVRPAVCAQFLEGGLDQSRDLPVLIQGLESNLNRGESCANR